MKKSILFLLVLCLLFTGCFSGPEHPETTSQTQPESSAPETEPVQTTQPLSGYEAPMLSFSGPTAVRSFTDGDGTILLTYTTQIMELQLEDPQVSEAVTLDFLNLTDFDASSGPKLLKEAREAFSGQTDWTPYSLQLLFSPRRLDRNILSLVSTQVVTGENPKATVVAGSETYDLLSGRRVQLKEVLVPDYSAEDLTAMIVAALEDKAKEGLLYSDYAYVIGEMFSSNTPVKNWYLSDEGLCFYFAPYEIAPYNLGIVTAVVPYSLLTGLLREAYFPEEVIGLRGTVLCQEARESLEDFSQFRELTLDLEGTEWLIRTDGAVEALRLETGSFNGEAFVPEATVFACATLCQGDALILQATRETAAALQLTYQTGGETVSLPLSELLPN